MKTKSIKHDLPKKIEHFSMTLDDCDIGKMREIFYSLSEEDKSSLLRDKQVKMGFDLMTKSYQEGRQPASVYNTCLEFYNMCITSRNSDVIENYLIEDPTIIPNKVKSFLIVFGARKEDNTYTSFLDYYVNPNDRTISSEGNLQTAQDIYELYNNISQHVSSSYFSDYSAEGAAYNAETHARIIVTDALSKRETMLESLEDPRRLFFDKYEELADTFSNDKALLRILSDFAKPQRSVNQQKTIAAKERVDSKKTAGAR